MAKGNSGAEDRAKVKLRVIEFELEGANASVENSIRQLTNALATRNGSSKPVAPAKPQKELAGAAPEEDVMEAEVVEPQAAEDETPAAAPKTPRAKPKPKPPTYLPSMLSKEKFDEFKEFAAKKSSAGTRRQQYLVAAFWMKEHDGGANANADKTYTLFKTAGWSTNFTDWRATFDNLVHSEHMHKVGVGEFSITPLGEDEVNKMA